MTEPNRSKWKLVVIASMVLAFALPVSVLVLYGLGQTSGTEFSPDDFSRRSFSYNQTPWLDWVIEKKTYRDATTSLEENLVLDGLVVPVINRTKNWHLISDSGSGSNLVSAGCDARFLTDLLDLNDDDGNNYWIQWNEKYPKSAKILWPCVAQMARDEMYLELPAVMQLAMERDQDDEQEFSSVLDQEMARAYYQLGKLDFELSRLNRALVRLQRSIDAEPSAQAAELLAKTQTAAQSQGIPAEAFE